MTALGMEDSNRLGWAVIALGVLLGGCSLPMAYVGREAPGTAHVQAFEERSLSQADLKAFLQSQGKDIPAAETPWSLETLALSAGFFSEEFRAAQSRWRAAVIAALGAKTSPKEQRLDTLLDHHSLTDGGRSTPWTLGLGFEWVLTDADRLRAKSALANEEAALAKTQMAEVLWTQTEAVILAHLEFESAKEIRDLTRAREALIEERLARLGHRKDAGLDSPMLFEEAQLALARARRDREDREELTKERARQFKALLHLPLSQHVPPVSSQDTQRYQDPLQTSKADLQARAIENRVDLAQAEVKYRWSDAKLRLLIAEQYPDISLAPGYEWDQNDHRIRLGLGLPLNLPAVHKTEILAQIEAREEAAHALMGLQEKVIQELAMAYAKLQSVGERQRTVSALLASTQEALRAHERALDLGEEDRLAVLDARILVNEMALQVALIRRDDRLAHAELESALGKPISP